MDVEILIDHFGDNEYRELNIGESILSSDIFIQDGHIAKASDIGNGRYSSEHFKHYRLV